MLVDFEKAFDTVEWPFIEKTLEFYSFGSTFRKWIKSFYTDITSAVINNGHLSEFFLLERGSDKVIRYLIIFSSLCWNF
jgi:hypothetical protein